MKAKVLISGAGGSLFPYLANILKEKYELYLIDSNPVIKKIYPHENIFIVPTVISDKYGSVIGNIIDQNKIEYYIPLIDEELVVAHSISQEHNVKLIAPAHDFIKLCLDKYLLMRRLEELNLSHVETSLYSDFSQPVDKPVFLKPRSGRGSRGIRKIENTAQLEAYPAMENYKSENILVQEYLNGDEYSVAVVVNNCNKILGVIPKRILLKKGVTLHAVTEENNAITEVCKKVVELLNPRGPFNIQLMVVDGSIKIFEINPRFSTTSILSCEAGINEFELCIEFYNRNNIQYANAFKKELFLYRRWESIFYEN